MDKLVIITRYKNGNFRFKLKVYNIYKIFRDHLGFRYTKINNKGYYLKDDGYSFLITNIYDMRDEFIHYIEKNFHNFEMSKDITYDEFLNEFYRKELPKNGTLFRTTLGMDYELSIYKKEIILRQVDFKFRVDEIVTLFQEKGFSQYIKDKSTTLYFKKKNHKEWIVLVADIRTKFEYANLNLFKIEAENLTKLKKGILSKHKLSCENFKYPDDLPKLNALLEKSQQP